MRTKSLISLLVAGSGFNFSGVLADDSVWRLDTIADKASPVGYCADDAVPVRSIASALIPFGDIIYGLDDSNSSRYQDSWFVGELPPIDNNIQLSTFTPDYYDESSDIPMDNVPAEISRGESAYYPESVEYEQGYPVQNDYLPRYEQPDNSSFYVAQETQGAQEYQPITQQIAVPDNSAYGNRDKFKNKTIRYYPFR